MSQNRIARRLLKKSLAPKLGAEGFQGKFPNFQRLENGELHLLSVEFDKHGGGFFLEFTRRPSGSMETSWSEVIPERELTVAHTRIESRARLQQNGHPNSLSEDWFRYENLSEDEIEKLILHVAILLPQVNDWLRKNVVGQNISTTQSC